MMFPRPAWKRSATALRRCRCRPAAGSVFLGNAMDVGSTRLRARAGVARIAGGGRPHPRRDAARHGQPLRAVGRRRVRCARRPRWSSRRCPTRSGTSASDGRDPRQRTTGNTPRCCSSRAVDALVTDPHGVYLDGTFGRGGHAAHPRSAVAAGRVVALDRDPRAIAAAATIGDPRLSVRHACFARMTEELARARHRRGARRAARPGRLEPADRRPRARLQLPLSTARWTCAWTHARRECRAIPRPCGPAADRGGDT